MSEGINKGKESSVPEISPEDLSNRPLITSPPKEEQIYYNEENIAIPGSENEKITCRNCLGSIEEGDDFISPCSCSGSMKYVHRHCLDQWRLYSPNPKSFYRCENCHQDYKIKIIKGQNKFLDYLKYFTVVSFDISLVVIIWQFFVAICCLIAYIADTGFVVAKEVFGEHCNKVLATYILGNCLFLFCLGLFGIIFGLGLLVVKCFGCGKKTEAPSATQYRYRHQSSNSSRDILDFLLCFYLLDSCNSPFFFPYYFPYYYGYGNVSPICCLGCSDCVGGPMDCNCGNLTIRDLDCGSGGDDGGILAVLAVIAIIAIIVVITIGAIVGTILLVVLIYTIINKRMYILKRKDDIKYHYVVDLNVENQL